jgi:hypothetical protein
MVVASNSYTHTTWLIFWGSVQGHQANLRESSKSKELAKLRLQVLVDVKANDACESKKEIMRLRE